MDKVHDEKVEELVSENEKLRKKMEVAMTRIQTLRELWKYERDQNQVYVDGSSVDRDSASVEKLNKLHAELELAKSTIKTLEEEGKVEKEAFESFASRVRNQEV